MNKDNEILSLPSLFSGKIQDTEDELVYSPSCGERVSFKREYLNLN